MKKIVIFGNSGSGKSTLAKQLSQAHGLAHLDLDTLAWLPTAPPERQTIDVSGRVIERFIREHSSWVIEGCYTDLIELVLHASNEMIFLNLPVEVCTDNARQRPWESHKYASKQQQDENLNMLVEWIAQYPDRTDTFSLQAHQQLFDSYAGKKTMHTANQQL